MQEIRYPPIVLQHYEWFQHLKFGSKLRYEMAKTLCWNINYQILNSNGRIWLWTVFKNEISNVPNNKATSKDLDNSLKVKLTKEEKILDNYMQYIIYTVYTLGRLLVRLS